MKRHKSAIPRRHDLKQITPSNENMSSSDAEKDRERIWCIESAEAVARYVCDWLIPLTPGISGLLSLASQYKTWLCAAPMVWMWKISFCRQATMINLPNSVEHRYRGIHNNTPLLRIFGRIVFQRFLLFQKDFRLRRALIIIIFLRTRRPDQITDCPARSVCRVYNW